MPDDDDHGEGCGCAVCATLVMGPFDRDEIPLPPPGTPGRCVFCRRVGPVARWTALGMNVCAECAAGIDKKEGSES